MFGMMKMARRGATAFVIALGLTTTGAIALESGTGMSTKGDRETFVLEDDRLAVTLAHPVNPGSEDDFAIWVGEVDRNGRKTVWVELIDQYGEVVYDSEVRNNETHLLPNGRAVVVRALLDTESDTPLVAKADQSRIAPDARLVVTRRVVDAPATQTTIEFIEEEPATEPTVMMKIATFGEKIWATLASAISAAADGVAVAWNWLTGTFHA